jgi:hypothetical protein
MMPLFIYQYYKLYLRHRSRIDSLPVQIIIRASNLKNTVKKVLGRVDWFESAQICRQFIKTGFLKLADMACECEEGGSAIWARTRTRNPGSSCSANQVSV